MITLDEISLMTVSGQGFGQDFTLIHSLYLLATT